MLIHSMNSEIMYENNNTASNRYYETKQSANPRVVGVERPLIEHVDNLIQCVSAEVSQTIIQSGYEYLKD